MSAHDIMTHAQEIEHRLHLLTEIMDRESIRLEDEGSTEQADIAALEAASYWQRAIALRDELGPELALLAIAEEEEAAVRADLLEETEISWPLRTPLYLADGITRTLTEDTEVCAADDDSDTDISPLALMWID